MKHNLFTLTIGILFCFNILQAEKVTNDIGKARLGVELDAFPASIPDGVGVIFKQKGNVGVAILRNQKMSPERLSYDWFILKEENLLCGNLREIVEKGSVEDAVSISFGPFEANWSGHTDGRGYIYLNGDFYIGIVIEPDIENLGISVIALPLIRNLKGDVITIFPKMETQG